MERIFNNLSPRTADLVLLVLASQNIRARAARQPGGFDIFVAPEQAASALAHTHAYFRENKSKWRQQAPSLFPASSFFAPSVFAVMALLVLIHCLIAASHTHRAQVLTFGASSLFIGQGETFRAVTALFIHSDARHLMGNLAGLLMFAAPLVSLAGYGAGLLMILAAGTAGNLVNAWFHGTALLSVGASTAVMGAAGGLAAFQMIRTGRFFFRHRVIPFFAAATLVAMLSQGENTDVTAHVFGFLSGLAAGMIVFPLLRFVRTPRLQHLALAVTLLVLGGAVFSAVLSPHFDPLTNLGLKPVYPSLFVDFSIRSDPFPGTELQDSGWLP